MKVGDRFIVTTGEYSDYGIRDSFRVIKQFSFDKVLARWLKKHGSTWLGIETTMTFDYKEGSDDQAFLAFLRTSGYVVDEELKTIHLHTYSRPETDPAKDGDDDA